MIAKIADIAPLLLLSRRAPAAALPRLRKLAASDDWQTREVAATALVEIGKRHPDALLKEASRWARDRDPNVRRAASEGLRGIVQRDPEGVRPILERLRADPERYVQKSVANVLRNASRKQPEFVLGLCAEWARSADPHTRWIVKEGLRKLSGQRPLEATRILRSLSFIVTAFLVCASTLAGAQSASDHAPYPAPGQLVDVGGWRLHLHCTGEARPSQPTVILEAGAGDFSVEWSLVQPGVARFARVCSYDRAGDGWSDLGPHPRTMRQIVYELHTLLEKAGVRPPFVLVGHSFGAWPVRLYAATYPAEVVGMVLVEGGFDNPWRRTGSGKLVRAAELATGRAIPAVNTSTPLRESDIPPGALSKMKAGAEQGGRPANEPPRDKLPADAQRMRTWALSRWQHVAAAVNPFESEELAALRAERTTSEHPLGDMPLVVLTRALSDEDGPDGKIFTEERKKEHAALAATLSRNGRQIIAARSAHHIQLDEPELVAATIRGVVAAARK